MLAGEHEHREAPPTQADAVVDEAVLAAAGEMTQHVRAEDDLAVGLLQRAHELALRLGEVERQLIVPQPLRLLGRLHRGLVGP